MPLKKKGSECVRERNFDSPMKKRCKRKNDSPPSVSKPFFDMLPQDIIEYILILLPVKTLIVLSCVCKPLIYLISNPKFIKTHLSKSSLSNHRLIFSHFDRNGRRCLVKSLSLNFNDKSISVLPDYPKRKKVFIVGSCNRLVCIAIDEVGVFFWNPSTRISKELGLPYSLILVNYYGFGYDHLNDDYKVIFIKSKFGLNQESVYSLKSNCWKKNCDFPYHGKSKDNITRFDYGGKLVDGVLHWGVRLLHKGVINFSMVIVSFDIVNETYGEIAQPCYGECNVSDMTLGVLEGCLSVFCKYKEPDEKFNIWVMKEYGVRDTWIKLYSIRNIVHGEIWYDTPLCITKTGEILLSSNKDLVLCNPTNGSFKFPKLGRFSRTLLNLDAITYVESLVSPNIDDAVPNPQH